MFLPMEVITSSQPIPVVQVSNLAMILSVQQVHQAISNLYKKQAAVSVIPFGMLDYDGLQKIQDYHKQKLRRKLESEEKEWLKGCESLCSDVGIDIAKVKHFFEARVWDK